MPVSYGAAEKAVARKNWDRTLPVNITVRLFVMQYSVYFLFCFLIFRNVVHIRSFTFFSSSYPLLSCSYLFLAKSLSLLLLHVFLSLHAVPFSSIPPSSFFIFPSAFSFFFSFILPPPLLSFLFFFSLLLPLLPTLSPLLLPTYFPIFRFLYIPLHSFLPCFFSFPSPFRSGNSWHIISSLREISLEFQPR